MFPLSHMMKSFVRTGTLRVIDAEGEPVWGGERYVLYRQAPGVPGVDFCSRRMYQTVREVL